MYAWCRRIVISFFALAVLSLGLAGWYAYFLYTDPETAREIVLSMTRQAFGAHAVELDGTEGQLLGGLSLKGFRVIRPAPAIGELPLAKIALEHPEMINIPHIAVHLRREPLFEGEVQVKKVVLDHPSFHFHRFENGTWDVARWITEKPTVFAGPMEIEVRDATLLITCADASFESIELTGINLQIDCRPKAEVSWKGMLRHVLCSRIDLSGSADLSNRSAKTKITLRDHVDIDRLLAFLPKSTRDAIDPQFDISGKAAAEVVGSLSWEKGKVHWDGAASLTLTGGGLSHGSLPYAFTNVTAQLSAHRGGLTVHSARGKFGPAGFEAQAVMPEWDQSKLEFAIDAKNVPFSKEVFQSLHQNQRIIWDRFAPEGFVDVICRGGFRGGQLYTNGSVRLQNTAATFYKFPYRVDQLRGKIRWNEFKELSIDVTGLAGNSPVKLTGGLWPADKPETMKLDLQADNVVVDENLARALPPEALATLRKFAITGGLAQAMVRIEKNSPEIPVAVFVETDIAAKTCASEWFPYEVEDVTGRLSIGPEESFFRNFVGTSNGARVQIDGRTRKSPNGMLVDVEVRGQNVPLDQKLQMAIPVGQRKIFDQLQPEGRVDVFCTVKRRPDKPFDLALSIDPKRSSITPAAFPYRLDAIEGRIEYKNGRTYWREATAWHGETEIRASGEVITNGSAGQLRFVDLRSPSFPADSSFRKALPEGLQAVADFLAPDKPLAARFRTIDVDWTGDPNQPMRYSFDGDISIANSKLVPSIGFDQVTGKVSLRGSGSGSQRDIVGQLFLDRFRVATFSAQNLSAQLNVRDQNLKLYDARGDLYGGKVHIDLLAKLGDRYRYECNLKGYQSKLSSYLRDVATSPPTIDGLIDTQIFLSGSSEDIKKLHGSGRVTVRDADIYGLPFIQDVFRLFSFHAPNGQAFEEVDCNFDFVDREVIVRKLDLLGPDDVVGPSLSLMSVGNGRIDLDTLQMSLKLAPRFARGRLKIPVLTDAFNAASDNLVEIPVGGTLSAPVPLVDTLPGLKRFFDWPFKRSSARQSPPSTFAR